MGHAINYAVYERNVSRKAVLAEIQEEVMHEDWQEGGWYRRKSYPADGTVVYEDAEADDARVEVVDQYVVIRETHEFPIVGEWTRDRRKFLKCEIRIHVPAGSIAQGEYDIS